MEGLGSLDSALKTAKVSPEDLVADGADGVGLLSRLDFLKELQAAHDITIVRQFKPGVGLNHPSQRDVEIVWSHDKFLYQLDRIAVKFKTGDYRDTPALTQ